MTEYSEQKNQNTSEIAENFLNFNQEIQIKSANECAEAQDSASGEANFNREFRPFRCEFPGCGKDYSNKSRLEIHVRTHVS